VVKFSYLLDMSVADFRRVIDIDLTGAFIMSQAVARRMREHGGSIVNISSIGGITPSLGTNAYAPGKAGLAKLSELMALEWGGYGIRVNTVSPGFIDGGMSTPVYADPKTRAVRSQAVPLKRLGSEEDIAQAVMFLASDAAGYISGHNLVVDGAITHSVLSQVPRA
jgi:NAD(P)-dependent dehydrogenase (short-subunit alcohol dehydrogenase family)